LIAKLLKMTPIINQPNNIIRLIIMTTKLNRSYINKCFSSILTQINTQNYESAFEIINDFFKDFSYNASTHSSKPLKNAGQTLFLWLFRSSCKILITESGEKFIYDTFKLFMKCGFPFPHENLTTEMCKRLDLLALLLPYMMLTKANMDIEFGLCCAKGFFHAIKYIYESNAVTTKGISNGFSEATIWGHVHIINYLSGTGANINYGGTNALCISYKIDYPTIIKLLISKGADVNINNGKPLEQAVKYNAWRTVKILLRHGADLRKCKVNLIRYTAQIKNKRIFKILIKSLKLSVDDETKMLERCSNWETFSKEIISDDEEETNENVIDT
jgi:hypothetical protein